MDKILTYAEVLEKMQIVKQEDKLLLLGNGFSIAYSQDRFSFTSLLDRAIEKNIIQENGIVHKIFKEMNTQDFEYIIRALEDSSKILSIYDENSSNIKQLKSDSKELKEFLVKVITNNHPEKSTEIDDESYKITMDFLKDYDVIYTLNYDLLLYWTLMHFKDDDNFKDDKGNFKYSDGFTRDITGDSDCYFVITNSGKRIHYLHGSLCIFDNHTSINKKIYKKEHPLKEQILKSLQKNIYPVFVSEGSSEQKLTKILHNVYLNSCYRSLQSKGKVIVIYGTYLKQNDTHIQEAIIENKSIRTIYIAIKDEKSLEELQPFIAKLEAFNKEKEKDKKIPTKEIFYFYRDGVKLWNQSK